MRYINNTINYELGIIRCWWSMTYNYRLQEEPQGWMGYVGQALKTSANYLPSQVTEMFNQGRDFAVARLPFSGLHNVCAITMWVNIFKQLRIL